MPEIIRNRTIRPSSRLESSKSYKVNTSQVSSNDVLIVNIDHESKPFQRTFKFRGSDVANRDSISFRVSDTGNTITITWSGANPMSTSLSSPGVLKITPSPKPVLSSKYSGNSKTENLKTSFEPIADSKTKILILGTMPGDNSIEAQEYYAHPRNRFWKIIASLVNSPIPASYQEKVKLLISNNIGIWDVAHKVIRPGSLDSNIQNVVPNNLDSFTSKLPNLKVIAFNGSKAEALYDQYFKRKIGIKYIALPSSSPANANFKLEMLVIAWKQILM